MHGVHPRLAEAGGRVALGLEPADTKMGFEQFVAQIADQNLEIGHVAGRSADCCPASMSGWPGAGQTAWEPLA